MEPGPRKSSDKHDEGIPVPTEVIKMMSKVRWPQVRMQDMLYNSLLMEPYTVFQNSDAQKDIARDMKYRDVEKVAKKIRESFKEEEEVEEEEGKLMAGDEDDEEHLEIDLTKDDSGGPSGEEIGDFPEIININNQDFNDDIDEANYVEEEEIITRQSGGNLADFHELDYGSSDENLNN